MKWFGIPVEEITAIVNGRRVRVGTVYGWADKSRKEVFDTPVCAFDAETLRRQPRDSRAGSDFDSTGIS